MPAFADHFSKTAKDYSQFRPGYPAELFRYLSQQCHANDAVWDCATGSGQSARQLTQYFDSVFASDASYDQTRNAKQAHGLFYLVNLAEQTPFSDQSLDLITVAQALHWFDLDRFYPEVRRILKPGGLLAVWTYNLMKITPELDELIWHLYSDVLGDYWPFERKLVEGGYQDLSFPFAEKTAPAFAMASDWSFEHLLGYLSTWSAVRLFKEKHQRDPVQALASKFQSAWGHSTVLKVNWPLSLKLGHT